MQENTQKEKKLGKKNRDNRRNNKRKGRKRGSRRKCKPSSFKRRESQP